MFSMQQYMVYRHEYSLLYYAATWSWIMPPSSPRQAYQVLPLPTEQVVSPPMEEGRRAFARKMWVGVGRGEERCLLRMCWCGREWVVQCVILKLRHNADAWGKVWSLVWVSWWKYFNYWKFVLSIGTVVVLLFLFFFCEDAIKQSGELKKKIEIGFEGI